MSRTSRSLRCTDRLTVGCETPSRSAGSTERMPSAQSGGYRQEVRHFHCNPSCLWLPGSFKWKKAADSAPDPEDPYLSADEIKAQAHLQQLAAAARVPDLPLSATLYPYQQKGLAFCLYKSAALIGDEMGLGKTLQAIGVALAKKQVFGFAKVLVVTMASLKEQWKREIERFSPEKALIVAGSAAQRQAIYQDPGALFKITNYEAVLRDVTFLQRFKPELVILDEAQRIKNFNTKTGEVVLRFRFAAQR